MSSNNINLAELLLSDNNKDNNEQNSYNGIGIPSTSSKLLNSSSSNNNNIQRHYKYDNNDDHVHENLEHSINDKYNNHNESIQGKNRSDLNQWREERLLHSNNSLLGKSYTTTATTNINNRSTANNSNNIIQNNNRSSSENENLFQIKSPILWKTVVRSRSNSLEVQPQSQQQQQVQSITKGLQEISMIKQNATPAPLKANNMLYTPLNGHNSPSSQPATTYNNHHDQGGRSLNSNNFHIQYNQNNAHQNTSLSSSMQNSSSMILNSSNVDASFPNQKHMLGLISESILIRMCMLILIMTKDIYSRCLNMIHILYCFLSYK